MTLLLCDGTDFYNSGTAAREAGWLASNSSLSASGSAGRFGGGALSFNTSNRYYLAPDIPFNGLDDTFIVQFAINIVDNLPASIDLIRFSQFGNDVAFLAHSSSGTLYFKDDAGAGVGTVVRTGVFIVNAWNYIQVKFTFNGTTGTATCKLNGIEVATATGADFFNSFGITEISFEGNTSSTTYIDDILIMDGNGSRLNDFIGDCRITTLLPTSDVLEEWTQSESGPSYELVDDAKGAPPDDTTYIESATPGDEHRFGFEDCPSNTGTVHALNVIRQGRKLDASDRTIRSLIVSNSVEEVGLKTRIATTGSAYWMVRDIFEGDPGDGSPTILWDETSINAIEIGVEVVT